MPTSTRTYYEVLGIARTASTADIKKAYRAKSRQTHPDKTKDSNTKDLFNEVNEAYRILSDERRRLLYDQELDSASQQSSSGVNNAPTRPAQTAHQTS